MLHQNVQGHDRMQHCRHKKQNVCQVFYQEDTSLLRMTPNNRYGVINHLFENVWAEVEGAHFYTDQA